MNGFNESDPRFKEFYNDDPFFYKMLQYGKSPIDMVYALLKLKKEDNERRLNELINNPAPPLTIQLTDEQVKLLDLRGLTDQE